jgi:hypothetical protein
MSEHLSEIEHSGASLSSNTGRETSSSVNAKKSPAVQLRKTPIKIRGTKGRSQSAIARCDSEAVGSDSDSRSEANRTPAPDSAQLRSPAQSASWVIEQDGCSLPSTSSDVSILSTKSKARSAFLDVRTTTWGRILKNHSLDEEALFPPGHHEDPQAASSLPITTIVKEFTSKGRSEFEEPTSIGPWESASQVARGTLLSQEQKSVYSRFFALPHSEEPDFVPPPIQLADQSLDQAAGVNSVCSVHSADATIDEPFVHGVASIENPGAGSLPKITAISASANTPPARGTVASPNDSVSVHQTSSLDSIEHALLEVPKVVYRHSQIHTRSIQRRMFSPTAEKMIFYQYGLDPIDSRFEVPRPLLLDDGNCEPGDTSPLLGNCVAPSVMQYSDLSLRGEDGIEELVGDIEDIASCHEYAPEINTASPKFANDMRYTQPNAPDEWQNEALFFTCEEEMVDDEMVIETKTKTEECYDGFDSISIGSADRSAPPERDANRTTNIHLWGDEAWPREEAVGQSVLQEVSHLTAVQKAEQDVARKLKDHWFPHKF